MLLKNDFLVEKSHFFVNIFRDIFFKSSTCALAAAGRKIAVTPLVKTHWWTYSGFQKQFFFLSRFHRSALALTDFYLFLYLNYEAFQDLSSHFKFSHFSRGVDYYLITCLSLLFYQNCF